MRANLGHSEHKNQRHVFSHHIVLLTFYFHEIPAFIYQEIYKSMLSVYKVMMFKSIINDPYEHILSTFI